MSQKKFEEDSRYAVHDLDGDGIVTDEELAREERMLKIENSDKMQDQQRLMAWVAMGSMVVFVAVIMLPIVPIDRVNQLSGFLNTFFVSQAAVVSVFMGATAYSKRNNDITVQAKGDR